MIEQLRALGLRMGTVYPSHEQAVFDEEGQPPGDTITVRRFVSWTTDEAKATEADRLGATLRRYTSRDPECSGWEVTANVVES